MSAKELVKRTIRWLAYRRYATAKLYYRLLLRRMERRAPGAPILVYQMGKVGSLTILESLQRAGLGSHVLHVHFLTDEGIRREEAIPRRVWRHDEWVAHVWRSQHLRRRLDAALPDEKWQVVTLVRDPIARNISAFFQIGELQLGIDFGAYLDDQGEPAIDRLRELFLARFDDHDSPLTWFDRELRPVFGVDVYAIPFDPAKGYEIYESEKARVLLVRLEDLRSRAPVAFGDFLGLADFRLADTNVAEAKGYADVYRRFVASVRLPHDYIERMYDSRYARHFYSEDELDAFRLRWKAASKRSS